ncbi:monocarboxylate transporter 2 [Acomys russatus]|uniref:monocarboxylate transporter 2 n=1 Tax=Acomys russatus TaxID=60746 RepID=UPI0021E1EF79|nr:monocarboxylate transporter 2 [Acomys russatus]
MPPKSPESTQQPLPPDGGWGWIVVFASFISIGFSYAFPKSVTVFFKDIQEIFKVSHSQIAWISSIMLAVMYAGGPISSVLVNTYGSRPVVMCGGLLCCIGMISASFSNTVTELYLTVGFLTGLGLAFNLQPALTILGQYFYRRRPLAIGLAMTGSPVFLSTLAPFSQYLYNQYGWRGSFLILGGVFLHSCFGGSLMRPVVKNPRTLTSNKSKIDSGHPNTKNANKLSLADRINMMLDFRLFKHRGFIIYLSGSIIMFIGFFAPVLFLTPYAKNKGVDDYYSALLLSVMAFVDMFSRPVGGLIANTKLIRPRIQYYFSISIIFTGICHLLCPLADTYAALVVYAIFFGLGFGSTSSVLYESLMDHVGPARFSSAVGLVTITECGPVLIGPPLAGKLVDETGEYKYMYAACGTIVVISGIWLFIGNAINYRLLEKEKKRANARKSKASFHTSKESVPLNKSKQDNVAIRGSSAHSSPSNRERESNI